MRLKIKHGISIFMILFLLWGGVGAGQGIAADISAHLPASGEVPGWSLESEPESFRGKELFRMINGGADLYHEYGFKQVVRAEYLGPDDKAVKLEIYQMQSPAAAYGIYTIKAGEGGKTLKIGQAALLQDYYLNFWKGDLLVTLVGLDSDEQTMQGLTALARAVDARIPRTGERPELASLLLSEPMVLSNAKYVRGPLGVMNSYIFDTKNIFRVHEGMIGAAGDCQVFVFRYADTGESTEIFQQATNGLDASSKFTNRVRQGNQYSMVGRDQESVLIAQTGRCIVIVMGRDQGKVKSTSEGLLEKLKSR